MPITSMYPGSQTPPIPGRKPRMSAIDHMRLEQDREDARPLPALKRCAVAAVAEEESALAIDCEDLLGYSVLRQAKDLPGLLGRALSKLEIEFLDPQTVERYKLAMLEREAKRCEFSVKVRIDTAAVPRLLAVPWSGSQWTTQYLLRSNSLLDGAAEHAAAAMTYVMRSGLGLAESRSRIATILWATTPLRGYSLPVPEFALEKARQIARAAPGTEFHVEELKVDTRTVDPFLIAVRDDELFYIEVWDEPAFESDMSHNKV
jgi:hypothetical protein